MRGSLLTRLRKRDKITLLSGFAGRRIEGRGGKGRRRKSLRRRRRRRRSRWDQCWSLRSPKNALCCALANTHARTRTHTHSPTHKDILGCCPPRNALRPRLTHPQRPPPYPLPAIGQRGREYTAAARASKAPPEGPALMVPPPHPPPPPPPQPPPQPPPPSTPQKTHPN